MVYVSSSASLTSQPYNNYISRESRMKSFWSEEPTFLESILLSVSVLHSRKRIIARYQRKRKDRELFLSSSYPAVKSFVGANISTFDQNILLVCERRQKSRFLISCNLADAFYSEYFGVVIVASGLEL